MSEGDEVISLVLYMAIIWPLTNKILTMKKYKKSTCVWLAVGFLAAIAAGKILLEWQAKSPNYYRMLGVTRNATGLEIKKAFKRLSLELHPDKNPSPEAGEQFARMKDGYDVLMDVEFRDIYNKLGPDAIKSKQRLDENQLIVQFLVQYVAWGVIAYLITLGKSNGEARTYIFVTLIALLALEVSNISVQQGSSLLPAWFLPRFADYEVIWFLKQLFPPFMNGARSLCGFLYEDVEKQTRDLLVAVQKGHNDILLKLHNLQQDVNRTLAGERSSSSGGNRLAAAAAASSGGSGSARSLTAPAAAAAQQQPVSSSSSQSPVGQLRELEERMAAHAQGVSVLQTQLPADKNSGWRKFVPGRAVLFFVGYGLFYYFTQ